MMSQLTSSVADLVHAQLDQTVGEQDARSLLHVLGQGLEGGADQRCGAGNVARRNGQPLPGLQQHRLMILQLGCADLWPLQIAQNAQRLALLAAYLADHLDQRQLFLVGAMRKIQARHIDPRPHQVPEDALILAGGTQGSHDLGSALGGKFGWG